MMVHILGYIFFLLVPIEDIYQIVISIPGLFLPRWGQEFSGTPAGMI